MRHPHIKPVLVTLLGAAAVQAVPALAQSGTTPPADGGIAFVRAAPTTTEPGAFQVRVLTRAGMFASDIIVTSTKDVVVVNDRSALGLRAGDGCTQLPQDDTDMPPHRVACQLPAVPGARLATVFTDLGDGADSVAIAGSGPDWLVQLGPGDDSVTGPTYNTSGETPRLLVNGGAGDDRMATEGKKTSFRGDDGDDTLTSTDGTDTIMLGGNGNDVLDGRLGLRISASGGAGADTIRGGPQADIIVGGTGSDRVYGDAGDDDIRVRDAARDAVVSCGGGTDTVIADRPRVDDRIGSTCEKVNRPVRTQPGPTR